MSRLVEPIDATHAECILARMQIRDAVVRFRTSVIAGWEPGPCPPDWRPTRRRSS